MRNDLVPHIQVPDSFKSYLNTIETQINTLPKEAFLPWSCWVCEELWQQSQLQITHFFEENEIQLFQDILNYLWQMVDEAITPDLNTLSSYYLSLQNIDESYLDETDPDEKVLYELIVSLDHLLQCSLKTQYNCALPLSQALIDVIDVCLQLEDKDILTPEGFANASVQNEIKAQLYMIWELRNYGLKSDQKHLFRNGKFPQLNREKVIAIVETYRENYPSSDYTFTELQFVTKWKDVQGNMAWILTAEGELFGEHKHCLYVVSDETQRVAYIIDEFGGIHSPYPLPKPKKKKRIHGVRTTDY